MPLRLVLSAPPASAGSSTSTASLRAASASISAREVWLPVSSSEVHSIAMRDVGGGRLLEDRARGQHAHRQPGLHVEDAGPVEAAVRRQWHRASGPIGHTVSTWPTRSTCRDPAAESRHEWSPPHVLATRWTAPPIDAAARRAHAAAIHGGLVVGRRFDGARAPR